ncbi:DUF3263 domain-containing protein [Gephyromycinifex aptenodytis]|uniref:DUF3263 domain-containing protein n=1 Tax=Gephyromycinifex aptenodytis TaxID=2716227 RepID=UPI001D02AB37|nr:DUF3263 domain-containing protein [Gephyromycinifex aptenodytis]
MSRRDLGVLAIERTWGTAPTALEQKLIDADRELGLDARGYALVVNGLIDDPAAFAHDPHTVAQLRATRDQRRGGSQRC